MVRGQFTGVTLAIPPALRVGAAPHLTCDAGQSEVAERRGQGLGRMRSARERVLDGDPFRILVTD
jgi:hypothetical protein